MDSKRQRFWQLVTVLGAGAVLSMLFRMGAGEPAIHKLRNTADRKPMFEIDWPDIAGSRWNLADHKGEVVLVNIWASWCDPCRDETPTLVRLSHEYAGKGFAIVGISADDSAAPVRRFKDEFHVPYALVLPPATSPLLAAVEGLPTSFMIDRQGRVANAYVGELREKQLRADIDHLLREQ